jgi:hypothetical protein
LHLWRNDDGTLGMWEMNGLTVVDGGNIAQVAASWHVVGAGDFNADGRTDILWQNDDGTIGIREMNGLSVIAAQNVGPSPISSQPLTSQAESPAGTGQASAPQATASLLSEWFPADGQSEAVRGMSDPRLATSSDDFLKTAWHPPVQVHDLI